MFWIYNPKHRVTLRVGSECVKHFSEIGVSGEEWERKAKIDIALQLDQQLIELRKKIKDKFSSPKIEYGYRGKSTTTHFNNLALDWYLDSNESDAAFVQKLKANLMKADIDFSVFKNPKSGLFYPSWRQIFEMLQPLSYSQSLDYQLRTSKNEAEAIKNAQKELLSWYTKNGESQAKKAENIAKLFTAYTQ